MSVKFLTVEPCGSVNAANACELQQLLTNAVKNDECAALLVDMRQVEFLDSAGLMAIIAAFRLAQSLNRRFSICSLLPSVRIIFELTQLDRVFEIFNNRNEFELALI